MSNEDWLECAPCRRYPTEWWFPKPQKPEPRHYADAKPICDKCPYRLQCLQMAVKLEAERYPERNYGMFGGMTPQERRKKTDELYAEWGWKPYVKPEKPHKYLAIYGGEEVECNICGNKYQNTAGLGSHRKAAHREEYEYDKLNIA